MGDAVLYRTAQLLKGIEPENLTDDAVFEAFGRALDERFAATSAEMDALAAFIGGDDA